jgi:hypothetical protein
LSTEEVAKQALGSIARNRRSSAIAILSVALALSFLFGSFVAIDTIAKAGWIWAHSTSVPEDQEVVRIKDILFLQTGAARLQFFLMSVPASALGLVVAWIGVSISLEMRVSDVRRMKSSGATSQSVYRQLMMENILLGAIAGLVSLAVSSVAGLLLLDRVATFIIERTDHDVTGWYFTISAGTVILILLSSISLMWLLTRRPCKRMAELDESDWSPAKAPAKRKAPGMVLDAILITLSLVGLVTVMAGTTWQGTGGLGYYTESAGHSSELLGLLCFLAMPVMLSVSAARLLIGRPLMLQERIARAFQRKRSEYPAVGLRENPTRTKRAIRTCIVVSIAVMFGIFSSVTTHSTLENAREEARYSYGPDIFVDAGYYGWWDGSSWTPPLDVDHLSDVESIPGVRNVAFWHSFLPVVSGQVAAAVAIDPEDYLDVVRPGDAFFDERGSSEMLLLDGNGTALVSQLYADIHGLSIGSDLVMHVVEYSLERNDTDEWDIEVTVVGTVRELPGIYSPSICVSYETMSSIPIHNLTKLGNGFGAKIDTDEVYDQDTIAAAVFDVFLEAGLSPGVHKLQDIYDAIDADPRYGGMAGIMTGEYAFCVLLAASAIGIIAYAGSTGATSSGREERAPASATHWRIALSVSICLLAIGTASGVLLAIPTAHLFNGIFVPSGGDPVPKIVVFDESNWLAVGISAFVMMMAPIVAAVLSIIERTHWSRNTR